MNNICFLDMDGVIADFVGGLCAAHGRPYPYDDPANLGVWDVESIWGMSSREFWSTCDRNPNFWDDLKKTHDADHIVKIAIDYFGSDNIAILTAPSMDPQCILGKRRWIQKHYPKFADRLIFTKTKGFLAGSNKFLIDDKPSNLVEFNNAGGIGVCVPRHWNYKHESHDEAPEYIKRELIRFLRFEEPRGLGDLGLS